MQEEKWKTEDEMVGQHHQVDGHELEKALGVMHRDTWHVAVCGVAKRQTQLKD